MKFDLSGYKELDRSEFLLINGGYYGTGGGYYSDSYVSSHATNYTPSPGSSYGYESLGGKPKRLPTSKVVGEGSSGAGIDPRNPDLKILLPPIGFTDDFSDPRDSKNLKQTWLNRGFDVAVGSHGVGVGRGSGQRSGDTTTYSIVAPGGTVLTTFVDTNNDGTIDYAKNGQWK